jgi:outer membrane protein
MVCRSKTDGFRQFALRWVGILLPSVAFVLLPHPLSAQKQGKLLTLKESIQLALDRNLAVQVAKEEVTFARERRKEARTGFLPTFSADYNYRRPSETTITFGGVAFKNQDQNQYSFTGTVAQPLFTGFATISTYQLASMGLDVAKIQLERARLDLILQVKEAYLEIVRTAKLREVAEQSVKQLQEGVRVAENFVKVGLSPKADLLDAETRLAQAELQLITATNNLRVAKAQLNTVLREPIDTSFEVVDVLTTEPYKRAYEASQKIALQHRPELLEAEKNVAIAEKQITLTKSDYYPDITLSYNYYRRGDDPTVDGSEFVDRENWDIVAGATWTFFEWGKTRYAVNQERARLRQAKENFEQIKDSILLEIKTAFLTLKAADDGIQVAQKQVVSAEENFRISTERYKEQVATATEVLDAQTRLTEAKTNYTNALVIYNLAKANLIRAMGLEEDTI